jgi:hypothetical protein
VVGAADEPDAGHQADANRRETVGDILERVVADKLDQSRLDGLRLIGVDEVSYGAEHKFLTRVADHEKPRIVWGRRAVTPPACRPSFDRLADEQKASIQAVSIDMSAGYENAIRTPEGVRTPRSASTLPHRPARQQGSRPAWWARS